MKKTKWIFLQGGAGLIGQNLISRSKALGFDQISVHDMYPSNLEILRELHLDVEIMKVALSQLGVWPSGLARADEPAPIH